MSKQEIAPRPLLAGSLQDLDKHLVDELQTVFADLTRNRKGIDANQKRIAEIMNAVATGAPNATHLAMEGTVVATELRTRETEQEKLLERRRELESRITVFQVKYQS